jgi:hypothetical protein
MIGMPTPEQRLTDPTLRQVPYGFGKVARYEGGHRWQVLWVTRSGYRRERPAMTSDVLAKQGPSDSAKRRVEQIVAEYSGGFEVVAVRAVLH